MILKNLRLIIFVLILLVIQFLINNLSIFSLTEDGTYIKTPNRLQTSY